MTKKKPKKTTHAEPVIGPTLVREWWLVDATETRTVKVYATGPKNARDIVSHVLADLYPPTSYRDEANIVKSFAHSVKCEEGRSTRDRR
jgi:hypothetical protein